AKELDEERQKCANKEQEVIDKSQKMNEIQREMAVLNNRSEESEKSVMDLRSELYAERQKYADKKQEVIE
ncbi:hypothetical protein PMAYCL1PPCAC_20729, partial [Pristionchus mayeri]